MSLTLTTAFKRFDGALAAWLVADATIASLTGHTADAPRIYIRAGDEEVPLPCLAVDVMSQVAALADVDGIYIARVSCSAFAVDPQVTERRYKSNLGARYGSNAHRRSRGGRCRRGIRLRRRIGNNLARRQLTLTADGHNKTRREVTKRYEW